METHLTGPTLPPLLWFTESTFVGRGKTRGHRKLPTMTGNSALVKKQYIRTGCVRPVNHRDLGFTTSGNYEGPVTLLGFRQGR